MVTRPPHPGPSERGLSRTEQFKAATTAAVRAISGKTELAVVFTPLAANQKPAPGGQNDMRLPMPPHKLTPENVTRLRGAADALALRLRHHSDAVHARRMPVSKDAVAAYNAMEQARVEVLGARQYQGVNHNLGQALDQRLTLEGYQAARSFYQVDLSDALRVLVHERCGTLSLGASGAHIRDLLREHFGTKLDRDLSDLGANLHDQKKSADILRRLIDTLELEKENA